MLTGSWVRTALPCRQSWSSLSMEHHLLSKLLQLLLYIFRLEARILVVGMAFSVTCAHQLMLRHSNCMHHLAIRGWARG